MKIGKIISLCDVAIGSVDQVHRIYPIYANTDPGKYTRVLFTLPVKRTLVYLDLGSSCLRLQYTVSTESARVGS